MGVSKFGQIWPRVGKGGQVWMGQTELAGWVIWLVGGCGYTCRSSGGCEWVWVLRLVTHI